MLKHFYKTFLVSLLSWSLLTMNTLVYAADPAPQAAAPKVETVKTEGIKDNDLMGTLTMSAVGLLTQRLWTCKMSTDMMLAAAGGAAYVAGEILAFLKLKKVMKDLETQITRDENGKVDQKQIETLEKLKQSYVEAKKTAGTKKTLQMAAAAAFTAAAAAAYMLSSVEEAQLTACSAAITASNACLGLSSTSAPALAAVTAYRTARIVPKPSMAGEGEATANQSSMTGLIAAIAPAAGSLASGYYAVPYCAMCAMGATCTAQAPIPAATCTPVLPVLKANEGFCPAPLSLVFNSKSDKFLYAAKASKPNLVFLNLLGSMLRPNEAKADLFSPLGIASSVAISYLLATSATLGITIDSYLLAPMNRAIIWGVLAGLTFLASSATDNQIKKIEANIAKIDLILNMLYSKANAVGTANAIKVKTPTLATLNKPKPFNINEGDIEDFDVKGAGGGKLPCFTTESKSSCSSFSEAIAKQGDVTTLPEGIQSAVGNIAKLADGINGTSKITKGSLTAGRTLVNSSAALKAELAKQQAAAQLRLKNNGDKRDLAKEANDLNAHINAIMKKNLGKTTPEAMLAHFGSGGAGEAASGTATATTADANNAGNSNLPAIPVVAIPPAAPAVAPFKIDKDGDGTADDEETAAANAAALAAKNGKNGKGGKEASMDDYLMTNDINGDKTSIFEVITNRYQKSGYQRLFKRIKE